MATTPLHEVLAQGVARLARSGIESARLDSRLLLNKAMSQGGNSLSPGVAIAQRDRETFETMIERRAAHEPLAYIIGTKEFWGLEFEVGPGVLVPRPDSETLIEQALGQFPDREAELAVLDLGTGSGCLLIAFLSTYPHARGVGVDLSSDALAWAERNVERQRLGQRCDLIQGSWHTPADRRFDVVLVNPPYLTGGELLEASPEISRFEPFLAVAAGIDGLDCYRELAPALPWYLAPEGLAFVEVGAGQAQAVQRILGVQGLDALRVAPDLSGIPRCIVGQRAGRRSLGPGTLRKKQLERSL